MITVKMREIYEKSGADALFLEQDFLRRYLIGFYSTDGFVVVDESGATFVADSRYIEAAQREFENTPVRVIEGGYRQALALVEGKKKLGVAYPFTDASRYFALEKAGFTPVDCMPALRSAMLVKSEEELALIGRACEIAEDAFLSLLSELKEGMTETECAALLEYKMRTFGAGGIAFETIVAFGANGSMPHYETGNAKLKFGDPVLIDFGCKYQGYCSDCTRTFLFGDDKKHEEFKQVYAHVLTAHELVKEKLTAGMTGIEGDAIARNYLAEQGLAQYFTHTLGHGIGLQIHEYPVLAPNAGEVLENGMVFSDEPGVYLAGKLGVRIEDTVALKNGKAVSFMKKTERNLVIL